MALPNWERCQVPPAVDTATAEINVARARLALESAQRALENVDWCQHLTVRVSYHWHYAISDTADTSPRSREKMACGANRSVPRDRSVAPPRLPGLAVHYLVVRQPFSFRGGALLRPKAAQQCNGYA